MTAEHPSIVRFRTAWTTAGGTGDLVLMPDAVHTAALAATALGCDVGAIANSLVFRADDGPVLLLTSGAHRVDVAATAERIGVAALHRADAAYVRDHTSQVIGGVSPLGHPTPVRTWIDVWLSRHPVLWAAAGHPASMFSTTYSELIRMTGAGEISVEPGDG